MLRRLALAHQLMAGRAEQALQDLMDLQLTRYPHEPLLWRIWQLRHTATAYDAAYLVLAEAVDAPLITCDRRLGLASGHAAIVEVI